MLVADGLITVRIEGRSEDRGKESEWIKASLDSPRIVLPDRPDGLPSEISVEGVTVGPSSFTGETV